MNNLRDQLNRPLVLAGIAFVVGGIFGLVVLGWWLWPVQWTDASAKQLRPDLQEDYLRMAIDSYARNPNQELAMKRLQELGPNAGAVLDIIKKDNGSQDPAAIGEFDKLSMGTAGTPVATAASEAPAETPAAGELLPTVAPTAKPAATPRSSLTLILILLCALTLVIAAVLVYLFVFRNRQGQSSVAAGATIPPSARSAQAPVYTEAAADAPVVQYLSTYTVGNDLYDDSFSIDSPTGEFLGECGVGISETIGVGDPKKVTAFEVWLFDKNDIQTVTKVLMSAHAFNDPVISQRLASKGEPVLAEPGKRISLETATLQLEARVVSMNYGQGALPANSNFEQVTLELAVWPKPAA
ncbi:MAG TPA: hypothetical protein PJ988_14675 [Anaerolinea sp.]|nr:hypothetical protein [Anaerolinea sp.]